jgi:hypothetical protein
MELACEWASSAGRGSGSTVFIVAGIRLAEREAVVTLDAVPQSGVEQQLVTELAGVVLETAAPEELVILDETAQEYFADPQAVLAAGRDEALGFGIDMALMVPYVLAAATPVVKYLVSIVADSVKEVVTPLIAERVRRLFRHNAVDSGTQVQGPPQVSAAVPMSDGQAALALSDEQVRFLRDTALSQLHSVGLDEGPAQTLVDALVGALVRRD